MGNGLNVGFDKLTLSCFLTSATTYSIPPAIGRSLDQQISSLNRASITRKSSDVKR